MELTAHDLLGINCRSNLISYSPIPEWVERSLEHTPFVVVRRARAEEGLVAVGIRGEERNERFGAFLPIKSIIEKITPEEIAQKKNWIRSNLEIFSYLDKIDYYMGQFSLNWGPVGSIGFELASGKRAVTKNSDIDLIIRTKQSVTKYIAQDLVSKFRSIPYQIDVQIEVNQGAFSLREYAAASKGDKILLRTIDGPMLKVLE